MWSQICDRTKLDVDCDVCPFECFMLHAVLDVNMSGSKAGSHVNGSKIGSNANETDNNEIVKRKIILTEKGLVCKIETFQKERQARVKKIKGVIIALKELMENDDNISQVQTQLDILMQLHGEATSLHASLMEIIPDVEKEKQTKDLSRM